MSATIKSLRVGPAVIEFEEGVTSKNLKEVLSEMDIRQEGQTVWVNGHRLSSEQVAKTSIRDGDEVRVAAKADQGR